jgi:hypothetical protein
VLAIALGGGDACALEADGPWCCGDGEPPSDSSKPLQMQRLDWAGVALRALRMPCSITATGRVLCRRFFESHPLSGFQRKELEPAVFDLCGAGGSP